MIVEVRLPPPILVAELPLPGADLSVNAKTSSSRLAKAGAVKSYRKDAGWIFQAARRRAAVGTLARAAERSTFYWPTKRRRDQDNALARMKSAWDGLQDAGIVADDSALTHLPPVFRIDRRRPRVIVEIFDVEIVFRVADA